MSKYIQKKRLLSYEKEAQERINKKSGNHNLQEKEINKQYEKGLDDSSTSLKEDMKKLKLTVNNLEKENQVFKKKIELLIEENQVFEKKIELLQKENHQIKSENHQIKSENHKIIFNIQAMDLKNNNLKEEIKSKNKRICSLEQTVKELSKTVKELSNFIFSAKIRKLLKRLLEYIVINYYDPYMYYDKIQRKLYFKKAPNNLSFNRPESEIVLVLNNLIKTIFFYSKVSDFVIHFAIKEENNKDNFIIVFQNFSEFFDYFKIKPDERNIILNLIPEQYLTVIDNYSFETKIPDILSKYCK